MLAPTVLGSLALFAFVTSVTPGPNNMMLMNSGLTFGFRRTVPHMLGIGFGFIGLVFAVALGLGAVLQAAPAAFLAVKVAGAAYLLYLAWKIATAGPVREGGARGEPMRFWAAAAFQWVNPKGWVMAVTAAAAYMPVTGVVPAAALIAAVFALVNLPSVSLWTLFGEALRHLLRTPAAVRAVNWTLAGLLVLSIWPMVGGAL